MIINMHERRENSIITCTPLITCDGWRRWGEMCKKRFFKDKACFPTYDIGVILPENFNYV